MRSLCIALILISTLAGGARAQDPAPAAGATALNIETLAGHSDVNGGLQDGRSREAHLIWQRPVGDVARLELLDEHKFGSRGGLFVASYTLVPDPKWILAGAAAAGHGGPNWARRRVDLEVSRKWLEQGSLITRLAGYHATYDNRRSDTGLRAAMVGYLPSGLVLEAGAIFNRSQPGSVRSVMPYASLTQGQHGWQYFSLRVSDGHEAYQALGQGQQLVDFRSRSVGLQWRRWLGQRWGFIARAERYSNPSYTRSTLDLGLFAGF